MIDGKDLSWPWGGRKWRNQTFFRLGVPPPLDWQGRKLGPEPAQKPSQEGTGAFPRVVGRETAVVDCLDVIKLVTTS